MKDAIAHEADPLCAVDHRQVAAAPNAQKKRNMNEKRDAPRQGGWWEKNPHRQEARSINHAADGRAGRGANRRDALTAITAEPLRQTRIVSATWRLCPSRTRGR